MARPTRSTRQKQAIDQAIESINGFFSAEMLYKKVEKQGVGLATIYRHLKHRSKQGDLFAYRCDGKSIYSLGLRSHCHFICEDTGKVTHFTIDNLDFLQKVVPGRISSIQIEVRGRHASVKR